MDAHIRPWAAAAALWLACAACESSGFREDSSPRSGEPSDPRTSTTHDVAMLAAPAEGTCWAIAASDAANPDHWFDDSPTVPCTEPHTAETAIVLRLTEATITEATNDAGLCWEYVRTYIGVDPESWVPWSYAVYLPSEEQVADGASWMRCDATFPGTWEFTGVRLTTWNADDPPPEAWACLDLHPTRDKQPFVGCDQPHAYEETGKLAIVDGIEVYPPSRQLEAYARDLCVAGVPAERTGQVNLTARWDSRGGLEENGYIAGACFMSSKTGAPLPPRN